MSDPDESSTPRRSQAGVDPLESATYNSGYEHHRSKKAEHPSGRSVTALKTWTSESLCFWPVDLLPKTLAVFPVFPRILTYSYDASKGDDILSHAQELAETVASDRKIGNCLDRPIIFVCHALGGIVVKQALVHSYRLTTSKHVQSNYVSTAGVIFLGTPNTPADVARWDSTLHGITSAVLPAESMQKSSRSSQLTDSLAASSTLMGRINRRFEEIMSSRILVSLFSEARQARPVVRTNLQELSPSPNSTNKGNEGGTNRSQLGTLLKTLGFKSNNKSSQTPKNNDDSLDTLSGGEETVPVSSNVESSGPNVADGKSAARNLPNGNMGWIEADHGHVCKFDNANSPGYEAVAGVIRQCSAQAPKIIRDRWADDGRIHALGVLKGESSGTFETDHTTSSVVEKGRSSQYPPQEFDQWNERQPFISPPGFRPNEIFVGMQTELEFLHRHLFESKVQGYGNSSVLITGVRGSGKTQLAREYVFSSRKFYPHGIFWINASSSQSMWKGLTEIGKAVELPHNTNYEIKRFNDSGDQGLQYALDVLALITKLEDCLLIFDGMKLDDGDDIIKFRRLIPRRPKGSVLYTSIDDEILGPLLPKPHHLSIPRLQVEDACKLLYETLGIGTPTKKQILGASTIVERYECLPLAIHALGHRLKAEEKSIEELNMNEFTKVEPTKVFPTVISEIYRLQKRQAMNLLHLLSFLNNSIPVRLIEFGCDAMTEAISADILMSPRPGAAPDLETTIETLMRYGLIERENGTETHVSWSPVVSPTEIGSGISYPNGLLSVEREIAKLNISALVQSFCRDEVRRKDAESSWELELQLKKSNGQGQAGFYDTWLILASRFLRKSFHTAQETADRLRCPLGMRDYKEYAAHVARLTERFEENNKNGLTPLPWYMKDAQQSLETLRGSIVESQIFSEGLPRHSAASQRSIFARDPALISEDARSVGLDAIDFLMTESSIIEHDFDATVGSDSHYVSDRVFSAGPHSTLDTQTAPTAPTAPTSSVSEADDLRTVYSDTLSMDGSTKEAYIHELAHELFKIVSTFQLDSTSMRRIADNLPGCLKAFSLRLGSSVSTQQQIHRDVTVFIHKYRHDIANAFNHSLEDPSTDTESTADENMPLGEKMKLWLSHDVDSTGESPLGSEEDLLTLLLPIIEMGEESNYDAYPVMPGLQKYRECVLENPAYDWLLGDIQRHCLLEPSSPDTRAEINSAIVQGLPTQLRFSRRESVPSYKVTYSLDWDLVSFLENQEYNESNAKALPLVITLTGSREAAQALTCSEYLHQTWPLSAGEMVKLLQDLLEKGPKTKATGKLPDGTNLVAWFDACKASNNVKLKVEVRGSAYSIAEIGEQLSWLGSALRSSPQSDQFDQGGKKQQSTDFCADISFSIKMETLAASKINGECWHDLFRNGVVVEGFPLSRRPEAGATKGLDIPLPMMARLAQASYVNTFLGSPIIKGFSSMLIPTEDHEELIVWHLVHNKSGDRISYLDSNVLPVKGISAVKLSQARHILGWCSNARHLAGTRNAAYDISGSHLPRLHDDGLLSQAFIYNGQMIKGGTPFLVGYKDTPIHVSRGGYLRKLKWIIQKSVVLWDEATKRGWLLNGASALLHLEEPAAESKSTSEFAIAILLSRRNRALAIFEGKDDHVRFEDRVEHFLNMFEQIFDYQVHAAGPDGSGYRSKGIPRAHFEGWDFHDLATEIDSFHPRLATFAPQGKAWVDFTRSIHAINLLGRDFGEILAPSDISCPHWALLPMHEYYLAAGVSDLKMVLEYTGDLTTNPIRLSENLVWHNPDLVFEPCGCADATADHSDIAQVILPTTLSTNTEGCLETVNLGHDGAVVFGYNRNFQWRWGDSGDPERGEIVNNESNQLPPSSDTENTASNTLSGGSESDRLDLSSSQMPSTSTDITIDSIAVEDEPVHPKPLVRSYTKWQLDLLRPEDYAVGIVCALPLELLAVRALFDQTHPDLRLSTADSNHYALGTMGRHKVVAACLPDGEYGTNSAADVASNLRRSFQSVKFCLLVGIGGGVPSSRNDIRLGDVVVSKPIGISPGVIQYDMGKALENGEFEQSGFLQPPPRLVMTALSSLKSDPHLPQAPLQEYIQEIAACRKEYRHPGPENDRLFSSHYAHSSKHATCSPCSANHLTKRPSRSDHYPRIHYGLIASGNRVMKDAKLRDRWSMERNVLCFEMEAAGIMNTLPCLVIRGICDYSDSHKNKQFQEYAAATAASYAKLLLSYMKDSSDLDGTAFRSAKEDQSLLGVFRRALSFIG
ncbi:hypothetical protein PEBR_21823 [Penicillium brasilianum]|uniref:Nucleoside phosphorylase domain-containing protein n=1 Tax=Penicillium brasilianum TaxID=104259 RepID=A0A1S9RLH7_PENBI|nr:hypothetical protein PEBR_21823 [Penicillium brasilianum]